VGRAGVLAGSIAVPVGIWFAGQIEPGIHRCCGSVPAALCVHAKADTAGYESRCSDAVIDAFGKNEQVKKVFWTLFVTMAGLVLARGVDPMTAQQVVGMEV